MKRIAIAVALVVCVGCKCSLLPSTMDALERSNTAICERYLKYVEADARLSEHQKQIERDLVQAQRDLIHAIREAHKWNDQR